MKIINIILNNKSNSFEIIPLGDWHIGDEHFKLNDLKKTIDYIKNDPNRYTILNGDLMNNALKTSKSDTYKEVLSIEKQQELIIDLLKPIADKILCMSQGNHEYRTTVLSGIDPLKYIAKSLGLLDGVIRYASNAYLINIKYGKNKNENAKNQYVIYGCHGSGTGGKRMGATINALEDMTKICPNADLYIHSHTHVPLSYTDRCFIFNRYRNAMEEHYRTFFNTNSFLDYGGYAEMYGFKPTDLTPYTLSINTKRSGTIMRPITNTLKLDI